MIFDPVNHAVSLPSFDVDDSFYRVAMSQTLPLGVRTAAIFVLPEAKRLLIRADSRIHHMDRETSLFELSIDILFRDEYRSFLSTLQLVLGECDQFHRQSLMIFRSQHRHFLESFYFSIYQSFAGNGLPVDAQRQVRDAHACSIAIVLPSWRSSNRGGLEFWEVP